MPAPPASNLEKYLARWAEPEARALSAPLPRYARALLVPALAEKREFLRGYVSAARNCRGRVLVIVVVNAAAESSAEARRANAKLLAELAPRSAPVGERLRLCELDELDVLLVDRSSAGAEIPRKQGVGLARKIAGDLAVRLGLDGRLDSTVLYFTDADVELPPQYFAAAPVAAGEQHAAALFPFAHRDDGDAATHAATCRYEASLRYHVLGLAWAGSPYAFHSIGSTLAVPTAAYVAVRGVPKLAAGEDFYLLDKLAKVGGIVRVAGEPIAIRSRRSQRVPFGTGPRVQQLLLGAELHVAAPAAFAALSAVLRGIDAFARQGEESAFAAALAALPADVRPAAQRAFEESGLLLAARAARRAVGAGDLRRRLHTWFDALATLRFLHRVRDAGVAELALERALSAAPFVALAANTPPEAALAELVALERALPAVSGPAARGG